MFISSLLVVSLHAAHYHSQGTVANPNAIHTPKANNNSLKSSALAKEKEDLATALKIYENEYGATHPKTSRTMANLAIVLTKLGDFAAAKAYFEKALKIEA